MKASMRNHLIPTPLHAGHVCSFHELPRGEVPEAVEAQVRHLGQSVLDSVHRRGLLRVSVVRVVAVVLWKRTQSEVQ